MQARHASVSPISLPPATGKPYLLASHNSPCLPQLACAMQPTTHIPPCNLQVGDTCNLHATYHLQPSNLEASTVQGMHATPPSLSHARYTAHTSHYTAHTSAIHATPHIPHATPHIPHATCVRHIAGCNLQGRPLPRSVVALTLAPSWTSLRMVRACTRSSQPTNRLSAPAAAKCCAAPSASVSVLLY